jgi:MFS family permease
VTVAARFSRPARRPGLTLASVAVAALAGSLMSSILLPALPALKESLHTTAAGVSWLVTAYFLAGAVATGIVGRLGDMFGKRRTLIITLLVMAAGSVIGGLGTSLGVLIVARALQGLGSAMFPLGVGIVRDQLPREKVAGGVGIVMALLGIGGAFGVTLGGLIVGQLGWHWLFWIPLIGILVAFVGVCLFVPESPVRMPGRINVRSAVLMASGLTLVLLSISEANRWGWGSTRTLGAFAAGAVLCCAWIVSETHSAIPIVDMAMMRVRGVWTTNTASLLIGAGIYASYSIFALRFALPKSTGYGFGASALVGGLYLLPGAVTTFSVSAFTGRNVARFGSKRLLVCGSAVAAVSFALFAAANSPLTFVLNITLLGVGMGLALPALGNLTVDAVEHERTGVATGMNTVMRMIGGAVGAQLSATLLEVNSHHGVPALVGFDESFLMASVFLIATIGATFLMPTHRRVEAASPAPLPVFDRA